MKQPTNGDERATADEARHLRPSSEKYDPGQPPVLFLRHGAAWPGHLRVLPGPARGRRRSCYGYTPVASSQLPTRRMLKKERSRRGARTGADLGTGGTMYHRAKRQGRAWLRGHFPYNEFTISRFAAGAHRACDRGTMPYAPLRRTDRVARTSGRGTRSGEARGGAQARGAGWGRTRGQ